MSKEDEIIHVHRVKYGRAVASSCCAAVASVTFAPCDDALQAFFFDLAYAAYDHAYGRGYDDGAEAQSKLAAKGGAAR